MGNLWMGGPWRAQARAAQQKPGATSQKHGGGRGQGGGWKRFNSKPVKKKKKKKKTSAAIGLGMERWSAYALRNSGTGHHKLTGHGHAHQYTPSAPTFHVKTCSALEHVQTPRRFMDRASATLLLYCHLLVLVITVVARILSLPLLLRLCLLFTLSGHSLKGGEKLLEEAGLHER